MQSSKEITLIVSVFTLHGYMNSMFKYAIQKSLFKGK